jgi:hypothetical protein
MKKLKTIAAHALAAAAMLALGMAMGTYFQTESVKKAVSENIDTTVNFLFENFAPEPTYAVTEPYPAMGEEEKAKFFSDNKEFYEALESGSVLVSPFILEYFYADSAGNNPVVLRVISDGRAGTAFDEHGYRMRQGDPFPSGTTYAEIAREHYLGSIENAKGNFKLNVLRMIFGDESDYFG